MNRRTLLIIAVLVAVAVPFLILSCTTPEPEPPAGGDLPVIHSLAAEAEKVFPAESIEIACIASAADGGAVTYAWWATGGVTEGAGPTITWRAPDTDGLYQIRVTVRDGRGGEATDAVAITVEAEKVNQPPIISSLTADADWVLAGGNLVVTCNAEDPDGHALSYDWSASSGNISGSGPTVTWTAPQEIGACNLTVVITDGYGGSATATLPVSVMPSQSPNIEALRVAAEHRYLRERPFGYAVGYEQEYTIECIASHPEGAELSYEWEYGAGEVSEVSEDGSTITWIAPNGPAYLTITVTVSDIGGNMATKSVDLEVVSCSAFG